MAVISLKQLQNELKEIEKSAQGLTPLLQRVGSIVQSESSRAFEGQRSPFGEAWKAHAPATLAKKLKERKLGARILQYTGTLAMSIKPSYTANSVSVGSNVKYAAIHQFGGKAGRGHKVNIPARPFLPINEKNEISPSLERQINAILNRFLEF